MRCRAVCGCNFRRYSQTDRGFVARVCVRRETEKRKRGPGGDGMMCLITRYRRLFSLHMCRDPPSSWPLDGCDALADMRRHQLVVGPAKQRRQGQGHGAGGQWTGARAAGEEVGGWHGFARREWRKQGLHQGGAPNGTLRGQATLRDQPRKQPRAY
jgi:hypothetical protein